MSTAEVKKEVLRLLKEDEEFRYAVAGLIGFEDLRLGQARLEESMARFAEAQARLGERQARLEERQSRLEEAMARLAEAQARLEERQSRLEEGQARLEMRQARLEEGQLRLEERQTRLEEAMAKLAEAQARTEMALQGLMKQVGRLSDTVGFGLEDIARVLVPGWLYRHEGINVEELQRKFIQVDGEEVEVNLYGEGSRNGERIVVIGETKAKIYKREVEDFIKHAEKVEKIITHAKVYKLMFGYLIHPTAEAEAKKKEITLIASYMR